MNFAIDYLIQLFTGLFDFFDRIFIQTGYIVWVGSAFLMYLSYRFLVKPIFGDGLAATASFLGSDSVKNFRKQNKNGDR